MLNLAWTLAQSGEPVQARFVRFDIDDAGHDIWRDSIIYPG